jgi:hypothetical protein
VRILVASNPAPTVWLLSLEKKEMHLAVPNSDQELFPAYEQGAAPPPLSARSVAGAKWRLAL